MEASSRNKFFANMYDCFWRSDVQDAPNGFGETLLNQGEKQPHNFLKANFNEIKDGGSSRSPCTAKCNPHIANGFR